MTRPACAGLATATFDPFFSPDPAEQEWAKALCATCPVSDACLTGARARGEQHGIWNGEDLGAVDMAEPAWQMPEVAEVHGSRAAYVGGCHCPECTAANTRWMSTWRRDRESAPPVERREVVEQLGLFPVTASTKVDA